VVDSTYEATGGCAHVLVTLAKCPRVLPVPKADSVLAGDATEIVDETKQDKAEDERHLEHGAGQFDLAVDANEEQVGSEGDDLASARVSLELDSPMQMAIQIPGLRSDQ
jgi:hypothetical protein